MDSRREDTETVNSNAEDNFDEEKLRAQGFCERGKQIETKNKRLYTRGKPSKHQIDDDDNDDDDEVDDAEKWGRKKKNKRMAVIVT